MDSNNFEDETLKKKLAYPYEHFNLNNFQETLNLTKEDFWSTLKQETPPDEEINRTQESIKKFNLKTGIYLTYICKWVFYNWLMSLRTLCKHPLKSTASIHYTHTQLLGIPGMLV